MHVVLGNFMIRFQRKLFLIKPCLEKNYDIWPRDYKTCVHSQTQNKAQRLAACGHVSASSQSLSFILSLRLCIVHAQLNISIGGLSLSLSIPPCTDSVCVRACVCVCVQRRLWRAWAFAPKLSCAKLNRPA